MNIAFGPVPSRRLGRSLGINNIPPKSCSYSCLYCQVGNTQKQKITPQPFYTPEDILQQVGDHLKKVDSTIEPVWKKLNRPHEALRLNDVLNGIRQFANAFEGKLVTETMLLDGINDIDENISGVANFIHEIGVSSSYIAIPTRPTAEPGICAVNEATLNRCYQIMAAAIPHVEYLIGYEGDAFAFAGGKWLFKHTCVSP